MYVTEYTCPKCNSKLKRTRLNKKLFCTKCREYIDRWQEEYQTKSLNRT